MITVRPAEARGMADLSWLDSRHTFSFGGYYDRNHMGFAHLRVINEDHIAPSQGFATHGHRDMEIITYVLAGALQHKDSLGSGSVIRPGDVQRMSAGTGILHSESNASTTDPVHLLQIWILPDRQGIQPGYEQKTFTEAEKQGKLCLVGAREGREAAIAIHQDVDFYVTLLDDGQSVRHQLTGHRVAWVQVASGTVQLNHLNLQAGDGAAIAQEDVMTLQATSDRTEVLVFDMAA